jgi:hypothetical protein
MKINKWLKIKSGTKLKIGDDKVEVLSATHISEKNKLANFVICKMQEPDGQFYLFAKIVDENIDVRILNEIDWIGTGDRATLIENGNQKLFQAPVNENNFLPSELKWTESIEFIINGVAIPFNKKSEIYGEAVEYPKRTGLDVSFASIVEYQAHIAVPNPEITILELGGIDPKGNSVPDGGLVIPLEGYCIDNNEIHSLNWLF